MPLQVRKYLLLFFIAFTYILVFVSYVPLNTSTQAAGFFGKLFGLSGALILTWQFLLGVRGLISRLIPDLIWVNNLHKFLGKYGFLLICLHPILITIYYTQFGVDMFSLDFSNPFNYYKLIAEIAFTILATVWFLSAFFRTKITFRWWKKIHLLMYIVLPLILYHSSNIGSDVQSGFLNLFWKILTFNYILVLLYSILFKLGILKNEYEVIEIKEVLSNVHTITLKPANFSMAIKPAPGQFIYIQPGALAENHPFTASHFDETTKNISVTPKASGPFSNRIQNIKVGTKVYVDGPYGVFTQEAYSISKPIVLIIGGIGITPFLRLIDKIKKGWDKKVVLFYANKTINEAAFAGEFAEVQNINPKFKVINVISEDPNYQGEKGRINIDIIKKYLVDGTENLTSYEFFVCGPPPMMKSIEEQLENAGVDKLSIHSEKFSL